MKEKYQKYLLIPKFDRRTKDSVINIYSTGWSMLTGRAIIAPHPHRHFTFEEFVLEYEHNVGLKNYIDEK